jgi:hypothetical protein
LYVSGNFMTTQQLTKDNKKTSLTTETVFPVLLAILSLLNISNHLSDLFVLTNLLSLVGIAGTILYLKKNDLFKKLIYIWVLAQVVVIDREFLDKATGVWLDKPFWDLTQVFSFKLGFNFITDSSKFGINVNIVAIFFFGLLKILEVSSLIGKQLTFKKFRQDSRLGDIFPLTGIVIKRVTLSKEKDWLLVQLSSTFDFDDKAIEYVLVKSKGGESIKQKAKNQLVYFRLVYDINNIIEGDNDSNNFPFIDWTLCK